MIAFPDLTPEEEQMRAILSDPERLHKFATRVRERWERGPGRVHVERRAREVVGFRATRSDRRTGG